MKIFYTIILLFCNLFIFSLAIYPKIFTPVNNKHNYNLEGAHYYYHYKNGKNYKKYNKPQVEEKRSDEEKLREKYNDKIDYNRDIDRLNNINIEKNNEIKMKFRNDKKIHLDYEHNY
jgi:hypothetical protein